MRIHPEEDFLILLYDVIRVIRTHADQMARKHGLMVAIMVAKISENTLAELPPVRALSAAETEISDPRSKETHRVSSKRSQEARGQFRAFP
jgi:hypothetical protein